MAALRNPNKERRKRKKEHSYVSGSLDGDGDGGGGGGGMKTPQKVELISRFLNLVLLLCESKQMLICKVHLIFLGRI